MDAVEMPAWLLGARPLEIDLEGESLEEIETLAAELGGDEEGPTPIRSPGLSCKLPPSPPHSRSHRTRIHHRFWFDLR